MRLDDLDHVLSWRSARAEGKRVLEVKTDLPQEDPRVDHLFGQVCAVLGHGSQYDAVWIVN